MKNYYYFIQRYNLCINLVVVQHFGDEPVWLQVHQPNNREERQEVFRLSSLGHGDCLPGDLQKMLKIRKKYF